MSDWQAGDLALCVRICPDRGDDSRLGRVYTVDRIMRGFAKDGPAIGLRLVEAPHKRGGSDARRFRKVTPPAADEFDRETIALMNGIRVGEPA